MEGKIPFWSAVLMSINILIGAGIFFNPQTMTAAAGSMSFLGWPLVGLLMFPVVWCIAQAARIFPGEGGFYYYCSTGINQTAGFIAQWGYLFGYIGTAATLIIVLKEGLISQLGFTGIAAHPHMFTLAMVIIFSLLNLITIEFISKIQSVATLIKLLPLFFVIAVLPWYWNSSITYTASDLGNLGLTIPGAIFAYWGFEACCSLGHFLKGGPAQVGKVILTAFFIVMALYMFFHLGLIQIMGTANLATNGAPSFPAFLGLSPRITQVITIGITGSIFLSYCNTIFGASLGNITNLYILAKKRLTWGQESLTRVNRNNRPVMAILVHGIILWALLLIISTRNILVALTNIGICAAFFMTLIALLLTHKRNKAYGQVMVTLLGFLSCFILIYYSWTSIGPDTATRLVYTAPLIGAVIVGYIMYRMVQGKQA